MITIADESIHHYEDATGNPDGYSHGLTKREHFAAMAMVAYIETNRVRIETLKSKILRLIGSKKYHVNNNYNLDAIVKSSVQAADALITELNKQP